jgi:hypothetical protein
MNIFVTDLCPKQSARNLCDKHISKMIVESAQLLSGAHWVLDGTHPGPIYKLTHRNHPCAKWVRESDGNYIWLHEHAEAICVEFTHRYNKKHKTQYIIDRLAHPPKNIPNFGKSIKSPFIHAYYGKDPVGRFMCHIPGDPIQSYRNFYKLDKARFAKWKHLQPPSWWNNSNVKQQNQTTK